MSNAIVHRARVMSRLLRCPTATSRVLQCRLVGACEERATSNKVGTLQSGHLPHSNVHLVGTRSPVLQAFQCLAAIQSPLDFCRIKGCRSLKDQYLDEKLYFPTAVLGICLYRFPSYFSPADFATTCIFINAPQIIWLCSFQNSKPQNSLLSLTATKSVAACC